MICNFIQHFNYEEQTRIANLHQLQQSNKKTSPLQLNAYIDELKGFPKTTQSFLSQYNCTALCVHQIRNSIKYVSPKIKRNS